MAQNFKKFAIWYAQHGFKVIPLRPKEKIPILKDWVNVASSDTEIIEGWWTDYPNANIGCLTGLNSGIFVLDVDCHGDIDGQLSLIDIEDQYGKLPDTVEQITGGGGRQIFFRYPKNRTVKNKTGLTAIAPGLEIKGDGGQVVLPPSIHPLTGREYCWEESSKPTNTTIAEAPEWLLNIICATPTTEKQKRTKEFVPLPDDGPVELVLQKCTFIQNLVNSTSMRPEPEWMAAITNLSRCSNGPEFIQQVFRRVMGDKYDEKKTNTKINHAINGMHPWRCETIRDYVGFTGCPNPHCGVRAPFSICRVHNTVPPVAAINTAKLLTAAQLEEMDIPEPTWLVPGLITTGLTFLCGKPKVGKSWLALSIALSVAYGGYVMGKIQVEQRPCLYVGLEDTHRRLKSRLKMLSGGTKQPTELYLLREIPRANEGGISSLTDMIVENGIKLVVIDTFQLFRRQATGKDNAYSADYEAAAEIKRLADNLGISVLLVHHLKKQVETDFVQSVSGSSGITGAADTIAVLDRARLQGDATLKITGRDVDEKELALKKDEQTSGWLLVGDAEEVRKSSERREILNLLRRSTEGMIPKDIATELDKKYKTVHKLLRQMVDSGEVARGPHGTYKIIEKDVPY